MPIGAPASEVSRRDLLEDRVAQGLIRHQPLQPGVLSLQLLQALGLVHPQAAVLTPSAVVRGLGDAEPSYYFGHAPALRQATSASRSVPMICSAVDRFRAMPTPPLPAAILAQDMDRFWGGQVRRGKTEELHKRLFIVVCGTAQELL